MRIQGSVKTSYMFALAVIGFVLMAAGFVGYVTNPSSVFSWLFGIGVVMLAIGYALLSLANRQACDDVATLRAQEERDGFFYIMDTDYSAPTGDATITDLRDD